MVKINLIMRKLLRLVLKGILQESIRFKSIIAMKDQEKLFQTDELLLRDTKETWELNTICDPGLDPGPEYFLFFAIKISAR